MKSYPFMEEHRLFFFFVVTDGFQKSVYAFPKSKGVVQLLNFAYVNLLVCFVDCNKCFLPAFSINRLSPF